MSRAVIIALAVLSCVAVATCLKCYNCADDTISPNANLNCRDTFNADKVPTIDDCKTSCYKTVLELGDPKNPSSTSSNNSATIRGCTEVSASAGCTYGHFTTGRPAKVCFCNGDNCNAAGKLSTTAVVSTAFAVGVAAVLRQM